MAHQDKTIYLKIDGVKGFSKSDKYKDQWECSASSEARMSDPSPRGVGDVSPTMVTSGWGDSNSLGFKAVQKKLVATIVATEVQLEEGKEKEIFKTTYKDVNILFAGTPYTSNDHQVIDFQFTATEYEWKDIMNGNITTKFNRAKKTASK